MDWFDRIAANGLSPLSENTRIAYDKGWARFVNFCLSSDLKAMPADPESVGKFILQESERVSIGTVEIWYSAINRAHVDAGYISPTQHPKLRGLLKALKKHKPPPRQVRALSVDEIVAMIDRCGSLAMGIRDAAILAVGFSAALRRSEICELMVPDVEILSDPRRMVITVRRSKTDQAGAGQTIHVPDGYRIRPVSKVLIWMHAAGIEGGYLFRTLKRGGGLRGPKLHHSDIPRIVKHYATLIGADPSEIAGHSLRAGFVTEAARNGARLDKIMEVTRHTNPSTVMKYIRDADAFSDHAGERFL